MSPYDFKIIFIHRKPNKISDSVCGILQIALNNPFFHSSNGEETFLSIVCPPKTYDEENEDNPRIEFCMGIGGHWKSTGCIYILEHFMHCISNSIDASQNKMAKLKYYVMIPSTFVMGVALQPFEKNFDVVFKNDLEQFCFGNILEHNKLFIQRRVIPLQETSNILERRENQRGHRPKQILFEKQRQGKTISTDVDSGNGSPLAGNSFQKQQSHSPEYDQNTNSKLNMNQRSFIGNHQDSGMLQDVDMEEHTENIQTRTPEIQAEQHDNKMTIEFEHDMKLINITFLVPYRHNIDQVCLRIKYASIIQVDLQLERINATKFLMRLMLRMKYPPEVWRINDFFQMKEGDKKESNNNQNRPKKRFRVLGWGESQEREKIEEDIKNSPVLIIDFQEMESDKISKFLGRFMAILKLDLQFRNLNERHINVRPTINLFQYFYDHPELYYWIEALCTRGSVVLDHWIGKEGDKFFDAIIDKHIIDKKRTIAALENLADRLIDRAEIRHRHGLRGMFKDIEKTINYEDEKLRDGYERVKKVIITPSRIILSGHEILMGNRVLRLDKKNYPPEKFLRVIFRDEDGQRVRKMIGDKLINEFIGEKMNRGICLFDKVYHFCGTSNSQMRDGGCYFLQGTMEEVFEFRARLGQFDILPSVPKMISRLGLCFTQGREIRKLDMNLQMMGFDFIGGKDSNNEDYIFSDGCGCLSLYAAEKIADEFGFEKDSLPSCYQFRYAGYKGVLSVNPKLDEAKKWWNGLSIKERTEYGSREDYKAVDFYFRPSQKKFTIIEEEEKKCRLEIVKYSAPSQVYLNRPFINILDQVSKMHSSESHSRICNRIHKLLDRHIFNLCATLSDEYIAKHRLAELQRLVGYDLLQTVQFTREPFFRLVLRAAAKISLFKLQQKLAIAIPREYGRVMFGIVDETGMLQYNQVFIRYSEELFNPENKRRKNKALRRPKVLTGPVLITKSPTVVGGDVRMFEAVNVPALHHLIDVVVFPSSGPRPHTDEMAGSDLDGDEYAVIWDSELAFEKNEPAADYSPARDDNLNSMETDVRDFQAKMVDFFVNYLKNDSIGRISNAHLFNSDLYGLDAQVCATIAHKHQQAVDFPKTGKAPTELRGNWDQNNPPERIERVPDYHEKGMIAEPQYMSSRLNGQLFRRIKDFCNFVTATISKEIYNVPEEDKWLLSKDEHGDYLEIAQKCYNDYAYRMKSLMDNYGIICEGELFSSSYSVLRNQLSDQEADDMSFYNTTKIIGDKLKCIAKETRQTFFATFGGNEEELTNEDGICLEPTKKLKFLARAYYTISYYSMADKRCFLSFPWVACWDVLDFIKRTSMLQKGQAVFSFDPFGDHISEYISEYLKKNAEDFMKFQKRMIIKDGQETEEMLNWKEVLWRYSEKHKGLDKLMFFSVEWARFMRIFQQTPLREEHICLLLISYGLLILPDQNAQLFNEKNPWLMETFADWVETPQNPKQSISRIGRRFCSFLEGLASRQFQQMACLHFEHLGVDNNYFAKGEWRPMHRIALSSYQKLVFTDSFDSALPPLDENAANDHVLNRDELLQEQGPVFQIELPGRLSCEQFIQDEYLLQRICAETECKEIMMRRHPRSFYGLTLPRGRQGFVPGSDFPKPMRVIISSYGTREALDRLRKLFAVHPKSDMTINRRIKVQMMPEETMEMLDRILNGTKREREMEHLMDELEDEEVENDIQMALQLPIEDGESFDGEIDDYLDDDCC